MSKRDITAVCTLAAHLAQCLEFSDAPEHAGETIGGDYRDAARVAADAMKLQRLGKSAMKALDKAHTLKKPRYTQEQLDNHWQQIGEKAREVLTPYGLKAECRDEPFTPECLYIIGLPANQTDGEGFAI